MRSVVPWDLQEEDHKRELEHEREREGGMLSFGRGGLNFFL